MGVYVRSVRYEDPGAVEGLAEALDTRLQVTAGVGINNWIFNKFMMMMTIIQFSSFFSSL